MIGLMKKVAFFSLFGNEQLGEILNCSKPTVLKLKKNCKNVNLLMEKRMGLSKSNRLFLLKPVADIEDVRAFKLEAEYTSILRAATEVK